MSDKSQNEQEKSTHFFSPSSVFEIYFMSWRCKLSTGYTCSLTEPHPSCPVLSWSLSISHFIGKLFESFHVPSLDNTDTASSMVAGVTGLWTSPYCSEFC